MLPCKIHKILILLVLIGSLHIIVFVFQLKFFFLTMAVVVGPGRKFGINGENETRTFERELICTPEDQTAAAILISLGAMGIGANLALMAVILLRRPLRRSVISKIVNCY